MSTKMANAEYILPQGLPHTLKDGQYETLDVVAYLNISKSSIRRITADKDVRKRLKGVCNSYKELSQEQKLNTIYASPSLRWTFLQKQRDKTKDHHYFPSLDQAALLQYDNNFSSEDIDLNELAEYGFKWQDIIEDLEINAGRFKFEIQKGIFSLWPKLFKDLESWKNLDEQVKTRCALALFAMATYTMDRRVLEIAIEKEPELQSFYPFLESSEEPATEDGGGFEEGSEGTPCKTDKQLLERIQSLAVEGIEKGLSKELINELEESVAELAIIGERIVQEEPLQERLEQQLKEFGDIFRKITQQLPEIDERVPDQLLSRWQLAARACLSQEELSALVDDLHRATATIEDSVSALAIQQQDVVALENQELEIKAEKPVTYQERRLHSARLQDVTSKKFSLNNDYHDGIQSFLGRISPHSQEYDFDTDYSSQLVDPTEAPEVSPAPETLADPDVHVEAVSPIIDPDLGGDEHADNSSEPVEESPSFALQGEAQEVKSSEETPLEEEITSSIAEPDVVPTSGYHAPPFDEPTVVPLDPVAAQDDEEDAEYTDVDIFVADMSSREIARVLLDCEESEDELLQELQYRLLEDGDLEWAYWLDRSLAEQSDLPRHLAEIVQLGVQLCPGTRATEDRLEQLFNLVAEGLDGFSRGQSLILASAAIRPALLAPHTHPGYVLSELTPRLGFIPGFNVLGAALDDFVKQGMPLADELIRGLGDHASWQQRYDQLMEETNSWLHDAPKRKIRFPSATNVWARWSSKEGELYRLVTQCMKLDGKLQTLSDEIRTWQNEDGFEDHLDRTDREINRRINQMPIRYSARDQLHRHVNEAVELADRWLELHRSKPSTDSGYLEYSRRNFENFKKSCQAVLTSLEEYLGKSNEASIRAGANLLRRTLVDIRSDFRESAGSCTLDPILRRNHELLRIPEIVTHDAVDGSPDALKCILNQIVNPTTVEAAIKCYLDRGYLRRANDLLKIATDSGEFQKVFAEKSKDTRRRVESTLNATVGNLENSLLNGIVTDAERLKFNKQIELCRKALEENPSDPDSVLIAANKIEAQITEKAQLLEQNIRARVETLKVVFGDHHVEFPAVLQETLNSFIAKRNFAVAEEILAQAGKGLDARDVDPGRILSEFQPARWFETYLERLPEIQKLATDIQQVKSRISVGYTGHIPELDALDAASREGISEALSLWIELSRFMKKDRPLAAHPWVLYKFLRWLGFQISDNIRLKEKGRQGPPNYWQHYQIEATVDAPLPRFGSSAHGNHSIVLVWNKLEDDQFAQWLSANSIGKEQPVTILYFNSLDPLARRRVIQSARLQGYGPIIIDQFFLVWLCAFKALDRTRALFNVGLAGGHCNPYTPEVAGAVPPEMFYGRGRDIENLWKLEGPCIIYGGRQLGKSALLQQVIRQHHRPEQEHYVFYSGAKYATNIWDLFRQMLIEGGLLQDRAGQTSPDRIKSRIKELLDKVPNRRILLLIDECDNLLEEDSRNRFTNMNLVRDLMTETGRRFKIVLAGLHNVQRFQRIPNQPLAHFGEPICIGPLDPADAVQLVQKPLVTLGYRFEPNQLVQRILANTNYHPSLIQLFCHDLVEAMLNSSRTNQNVPPFVIDEQTIATVYRKSSLNKKMRDRFDWTLDLDQRYRAIGYTFAYLELTEKPDVASQEAINGYRVIDILARVQAIWPKGFASTSIDELTGLLDEMIGLGVLMGTTGRRYRLRSPNVLTLLGDEDAILAELSRFAGADYEQPAGPQIIRRILDSTDKAGISSPLTLYQESELIHNSRGVNILLGSKATGIDRVVPVIEGLFRKHSASGTILFQTHTFDSAVSAGDLLATVKSQYQKKSQQTNSLRIILNPGTMSDKELFEGLVSIAAWIDTLSAEQRFLRVICPLDSPRIVALHLDEYSQRLAMLPNVSVITLRRWSESGQEHWFADVNRPPQDSAQPKRWIERTGGWPALVEMIQRDFLEQMSADPEIALDKEGFIEKTGISFNPELAKTYRVLSQIGDEIDMRDLADFVVEDGVPAPLVAKYAAALLDLELATGTPEGMRAEPFASAIFASITAAR